MQHATRGNLRPIVLIAALCGLLVGCSAGGSVAGGGAPTTYAPSSAMTSAAAASASPSTPAPSATSASSASSAPVLGEARGITEGYGSIRPSTISNGGDPTGLVTDVLWTSWGGARAVGTGMAYYDPPNVPVSSATLEQATVVAFDPGPCDGQYMYQAIEWYFPESGGSFKPASYLNICSWTLSPGAG